MTEIGTATNPQEEKLYDNYLISWTKPLMNGITPTGRGGHTATFAKNKLIIFGGHYFGGNGKFIYLNDILVLNLETSAWSQVKCGGNFPPPRYNHSTTLIDSRLYIFGGRGENGAVFKDMYFLDIDEWSWYGVQWTTDSPSPRFGHSDVVIGNKIVIFGGWNGVKCYNDLWVMDTDTFTWMKPKTGDKAPAPRHGHSMTLTQDRRIVVFGGYSTPSESNPNQKAEYHRDIYVFDTELMIWSRPRIAGEYPSPRFGHCACAIGDIMFILGGWSGTTKSTISLGDQKLKEIAREKARERRLQSGYVPASLSPSDSYDYSKNLIILNTTNMTWEIPPCCGVDISNRYGHTCTVVGPQLFVFGGWDGNRALNELYVGVLPVEEENK